MGGGYWINRISFYADAQIPPDRVILATLDPLMHWKVVATPEIRRPEDLNPHFHFENAAATFR
jgi:hypothetical protein